MGTDHWMQAVIELLHQHKCKSHAPPKRLYESQPPDSLVTTTQIAKEYGCGAKVFNRLLHLHGIQYRTNNQWVLYAKHQYQVAVQKQEAAFKKVMLAVNDIEKAFSHGNPWLMKFRAISIPEKLERTHLKEWLDHVWIVDFEQVEVILQESKWKGFFPEEWLNNGEEDCNGKKE